MRLFSFFRRRATETNSPKAAERRARSDDSAGYSADRPIQNPDEDIFNRWPFARRIAETFTKRHDPSSLVLGIYGPWGDGKTSALNLLETALTREPNVIPVRFNPWYFDSQEQLIRSLFSSVADALGRSLPSKSEEIGRLLDKYGSILALASVTIGGVVHVSPGSGLQEFGKRLSTTELDELRKRFERILSDSGKRIVVLVDDIDRLDRQEIQSVLKLVKLSAAFDHTAFVLAFDDQVVADALGEKYGEGGREAGRAFLEKIVQVPLHLPPAETMTLRQLTFSGVDAALNEAGIQLTEEQTQAVVRYFVSGVEMKLGTPRQAKRYGNAVAFALPLLKGEVNPVDQLLIEAIRVFFPKTYGEIRDNPDIFVPTGLGRTGENTAIKQRTEEVVNRAFEGLAQRERRGLQDLLEYLFPRLKTSLGNVHYGSEWDTQWAREQRICSEKYFQRYFQYGLPPRDIGDREIQNLLALAASRDTAALESELRASAGRNALPRMIEKLRLAERDLPAPAAAALALVLVRIGDKLPREKGVFSGFASTYAQAAILVAHLVRLVRDATARADLAKLIATQAKPLTFGVECFRWLRSDKEKESEAGHTLTEEAETQVGEILAERIAKAAETEPPYISFAQDLGSVLWIWKTYGKPSAASKYLVQKIEESPSEVVRFLVAFVGEAWGLESGLSHKSDFERGSYNFIAELVSPDSILLQLKSLYGSDIDAAEYYSNSEISLEERVARQFAFIHRKVAQERDLANAAEAKSET